MNDTDKRLAIERDAVSAMEIARVSCARRPSFRLVGLLAMHLKPVLRWDVKTAETDGVELRYNPEFFLSLDADQRLTLVAHEALHPTLRHHTRRQGRDMTKWNLSADYPINETLEKMGFAPIPGWLRDKQFDGWNAERIYSVLPDPPHEDDGGGDGDGDDGDGKPDMGPGGVVDAPSAQDDAEREAEDARWGRRMEQAAQTCKKQGCLPEAFERVLDDLRKPRTNWRAILRAFLTKHLTVVDYTYRPLNRRYLPLGIYAPSTRKEDAPDVVILQDVSGSISQPEFTLGTSHLAKILREVRPKKVWVIYADTVVQQVDVYQGQTEIRLSTRKGGGGTDFRPVFDYIKEQGIRPRLMIAFTDLFATLPERRPRYPVLWAVWGNHGKAPWGRTVEIDAGGKA